MIVYQSNAKLGKEKVVYLIRCYEPKDLQAGINNYLVIGANYQTEHMGRFAIGEIVSFTLQEQEALAEVEYEITSSPLYNKLVEEVFNQYAEG